MISDLGKNIRMFREKKSMTLKDLQLKSGCGYSTLHDIENGKSKTLNSINLEKVSKALEVSVNELINGYEYEVVEYEVSDLLETISMIFESDELSLDGKLLSNNEKSYLKNAINSSINLLRDSRNIERN